MSEQRKAFEAWIRSSGPPASTLCRRTDGAYVKMMTGIQWLAWQAALAAPAPGAPIDMVLHCPKCGLQHVDRADEIDPYPTPEKDASWWGNPPHRSHLCARCNHVWRPADVPTNGVEAVKTAGKSDSPIAQAESAPATQPALDERAMPPLPAGVAFRYVNTAQGAWNYAAKSFASSFDVFPMFSPEQMHAYVMADRALAAAPAEGKP